ncbi:putative toxin [Campylobacter jejuni]|uniref:putative toxin n=1 Tax=Campylobacter jejuni TaxID=197 RepID=UPI0011A8D5D0|nr:putative toxin [Campylobacter jejuni]
MKFNDVKFKIKEFESVDIISGYSLAFYLPKEEHMMGEKNKNENQKTKKDEYRINKSNSLEYIQKINEEKEKEIEKLKLQSNEKINEEFDKLKDDALPTKEYKRKDYEYDVFYDVYTSKDNINKCIKKIPIENGVATVTKDFLEEFYENSVKGQYNYKWCLIPRLIRNEGESSFDPVPTLNSSFVISELSNIKQKTLTFQRKIAQINNPDDFKFQTPEEFKEMLNNKTTFAAYGGKKQQIEDLIKTAKLKLKMLKKLEPSEISEDAKESLIDKQNKKIEECEKIKIDLEKNENRKITPSVIGDAGEYITSLLFKKRSTRHLSNQRKIDANFNLHSFNHTIPDFLVIINDIPSLVEVKNVQVQSLTEQISFELKLAREYELDYFFICNNYTQLTENLSGSALTLQEHEALIKNKDKVKEFDEETKAKKKNTVKEVLRSKDKNWYKVSDVGTSRLRNFSEEAGDQGSRNGFIYHKHLHRSIKTVFKEMYLHHIKGVAPNKIVIKRFDLNYEEKLEEIFNQNQELQKNSGIAKG